MSLVGGNEERHRGKLRANVCAKIAGGANGRLLKCQAYAEGPLFLTGHTVCKAHGKHWPLHTLHRLKANVKGCGQNWVTYVYFQVLSCTIPGVNRRCIKYRGRTLSVFAGNRSN